MNELGEQLRLRRRELSLSQADLADLADVSERTVRALEQGKHTARLDVLTKVLETLGLRLVATLRERHG